MESDSAVADLLEITLPQENSFLIVKETLTRIGVASREENRLYQSCHILHKKGKYYIVHFKELFKLDAKPTNMTENDVARRNTIAKILEEWGLLKIVNKEKFVAPLVPMGQIKVLTHAEKKDWECIAKYQVGRKKRRDVVEG